MVNDDIPRFSEFGFNQQVLDGDRKKIVDIIDMNIIVHDWKFIKDKFAEDPSQVVAMIQISINGDEKKYVAFTRSGVLIKQLGLMNEHKPFKTRIVKVKRYLTFS